MCLAIPARVEQIDSAAGTAVVNLNNVRSTVSTALIEDLAIGDYLLIHVGFALSKISEREAQKTLALFAEAGLTGNRADCNNNGGKP